VTAANHRLKKARLVNEPETNAHPVLMNRSGQGRVVQDARIYEERTAAFCVLLRQQGISNTTNRLTEGGERRDKETDRRGDTDANARPCESSAVFATKRMEWEICQSQDPFTCALRLILLCFTAFGIGASAAAAEAAPSYWTTFKTHLSTQPGAFQIRFDEGDVTAPSRESVETMDSASGKLTVIRQSRRTYEAICQSNAFSIVQSPRKFSVNAPSQKDPVEVVVSPGSGFYGDTAWSRSDPIQVQVGTWDPGGTATNKVAVQVWSNYKKVWGIYYLGLPKLKPGSIHWDESRLAAATDEGSQLRATFSLEPSSGKVVKGVYHISGKMEESGDIVYSYESGAGPEQLPSIVEKRVTQARDPYAASRESFKVKLLEVQPLRSPISEHAFQAPVQESRIMTSNGVVFSNVKGKWLVPEKRLPWKPETENRRRQSIVRIVVAVAMLASFGALVLFLVRKQKQTESIVI
jgi:hypothetical protein